MSGLSECMPRSCVFQTATKVHVNLVVSERGREWCTNVCPPHPGESLLLELGYHSIITGHSEFLSPK
jgi:hypothetical protein